MVRLTFMFLMWFEAACGNIANSEQRDAGAVYDAAIDTQAPPSTGCAAGSVWEWNGSAWACTALPGTGSCTWATASSTAASLSAVCPAGTHAATGGCDAGTGGSLVSSRPSGPTAPPANGALGSTVNQWSCRYSSTTTTHAAYALCCAQ